ncbi:6210_t:CDS:1 [Diversispora eburnea]|uniref:Importin subunit alpha n=1 Tax=Diversispora eburnea TaxID=1213867 RepID=A0A9N8YJ65_9GLOM|nr:6210_t:CDS:1 [Diversispora eburnea]
MSRILEQRKKVYKNKYVFDSEELFQKRQKQQIEIRRQSREQVLASRRNYQVAVFNNDLSNIDSNDNSISSRNSTNDKINTASISPIHLYGDISPIQQLGEIRSTNISPIPDLGEMSTCHHLSEIVEDINSNSVERQLISLTKIRKILSKERIPPIQQVIDCGIVPRFVQFLTSINMSLRHEAAWVITNIVTGISDQVQVVINAGALPVFMDLLNSSDRKLQDHALWALGNIAADFRELVLRTGNLGDSCLRIIDEISEPCSVLRTMAWTLSSICRGKISINEWPLIKPTLPAISRLINYKDDEILHNICWALSFLADGSTEQIDAIINLGVCPDLVNLMLHESYDVQTAALRCVRHIVAGNDLQTQVILDCGVLTVLKILLISNQASIRKDACFILSNITAGNIDQITHVIHVGLIPLVINLLTNSDFQTQREACWVIHNAIKKSCSQTELTICIIRQGCIQPLVNVLSYMDNDIIFVALQAIWIILQVGETLTIENNGENPYSLTIEGCGGMERINNFQFNENKDIRLIAYQVMDKFFSEENEERLINESYTNGKRLSSDNK